MSPRTLAFLERDGRWLFLRGGPTKWFRGRLNGVGGHVEPGESVEAAARREIVEETGLVPLGIDLAAVVHVIAQPPVMLFVFRGNLPDGDVVNSSEGELAWRTTEAVIAAGPEFLPDVALLFREANLLRDATGRPEAGPPRSLVLDQTGPDAPRLNPSSS